MKVLLVGGGGREHALAWRFLRDAPHIELIVAPGNPGIAALARCVDVGVLDIDGLVSLARRESVSLTVVGPEAPLAAGIVDRFREVGLSIFGPTAAAARIETSKAFSKDLMRTAGVPTADAVICTTIGEARRAIDQFGAPVVIKASGLAAGKGVAVCETIAAANDAAAAMLAGEAFGSAGTTIVVEEFMRGEELSLFVVTDGTRAVPLIAAQDHKRLLDGDRGPNTGGMGAYAPVSLAPGAPTESPLIDDLLDRIVHPTLNALREAGCPFTGVLFVGLMLTDDGPKVVEFNCRLGDPETEAILPILDASPSLFDLIRAVAFGDPLPDDTRIKANGCAVTTVVAAKGYPEKPTLGDPIDLPPATDGVLYFHAGTKRDGAGTLVTAGGRVLAVTATAATVAEAAHKSVAAAAAVEFAGKQLRRDIAWRELGRTGAVV
ncbi:MAG TPA: phosphoribosylamine--glycine ligase [Gemmatimonadaceae bacterium]|nr:phosphoribosylamine--glycine ligase [Gemmatimonadaceae bacterium]